MAQFNLGCCYRDGIGVELNYEEMLKYFRLAVDQGNANAQFNLGFCYYIGQGVEQDYDEAFRLYQLAADQGFPVAIFAVGDCYYLGQGVEKKTWTKRRNGTGNRWMPDMNRMRKMRLT